ncbi:MAG TPA: gamma-glutamyltransferase family protein [Dongiaceae bacterium]|nr:gamma-glutamyltransferase family protein [Dongiaceae bacterium]
MAQLHDINTLSSRILVRFAAGAAPRHFPATELPLFQPDRDYSQPRRSAVIAEHGAAATAHPLATLIAIDILRAGGNAVDAAIAATAALGVIEPAMTGIGGDCFVLIAPKGSDRIVAYNGAGRAPAAAKPDWFLERGINLIAPDSVHSVTVPGAVEAWCRLADDHGKLGIDRLLQPAIQLAAKGFAVAPRVAADWRRNADRLRADPAARAALLPKGKPPVAGDRIAFPALARALKAIARDGAEVFYSGWIAEDIVRRLRAEGGLHTREDFARHRGDYADPISTGYRGTRVWECPPPGQGLTTLMLLNILAECPPGDGPLSAARCHTQIEASKLAYAERDRHLCDPQHGKMPLKQLLSRAHARRLAAVIDPARAMTAVPPSLLLPHRDTTYLTVVDKDRTAVSFINSIYYGFGSGRIAPKSGVVLQNRGACFVVEPGHPNCIGPGKRPMHTIIPAMVTKGGRALVSFGVMGGHYQPVGHAHVLGNMLEFGMDPQAALDCPRLFFEEGGVTVEAGIPDTLRRDLLDRGHRIVPAEADDPLGGGQVIAIDWRRGVLVAGSEPRKDGLALGY